MKTHTPRNTEIFHLSASDFMNADEGSWQDELMRSKLSEDKYAEMNETAESLAGWYWWTCCPGCLPDSEASGPFETEMEANEDAGGGEYEDYIIALAEEIDAEPAEIEEERHDCYGLTVLSYGRQEYAVGTGKPWKEALQSWPVLSSPFPPVATKPLNPPSPTMKNIFFTTDHQTGSLSTGGFDDLESAQEYARRHNGGRNTILEDCRAQPHAEAKRILAATWGNGRTLTSFEYEVLVRLCGYQDLPCGEHPSALYMALALSGLLAKWDAEERPRSAAWFAFVNA